eukprot:4878755-Alexandrium_andersonii.AAC.1
MDVLTKWQSDRGRERSDTERGRSPGGADTKGRRPARTGSAERSGSDQDTSGDEAPKSQDAKKKKKNKKNNTGATDSGPTPLATALQDVARRTNGCTDAE